MKLIGKVAIVTGANSGIGLATSLLFAKEGAKVVLAARDETRGRETTQSILGSGGTAVFVRTDVRRDEDMQKLIRTAMEKYGRIDILVNAAGIWEVANIVETSEELWQRTIDTDLKGAFLGMKYAIPKMVDVGGGSIINVSSVGGVNGAPNECAYGAAKGGLVLMTKGVAIDFASKNIRVNCICPGGTDTPMTTNWLKASPDYEKELSKLLDMVPIRRLIKPAEVANLALFLASDDSSGITGTILPVDGGYLAM